MKFFAALCAFAGMTLTASTANAADPQPCRNPENSMSRVAQRFLQKDLKVPVAVGAHPVQLPEEKVQEWMKKQFTNLGITWTLPTEREFGGHFHLNAGFNFHGKAMRSVCSMGYYSHKEGTQCSHRAVYSCGEFSTDPKSKITSRVHEELTQLIGGWREKAWTTQE